jgi:NAD(P)-dependent dehydrogenase (short-subunit alcohol dehydrogenase family)
MPEISELFNLQGRVAAVTGGAGLLGSEFCRTLAEAGAQVVVADLNAAAADILALSLVEKGCSAAGVGVDVTSADSVKGMVEATLDSFGRLDILVNSAALDPKFDPSHGAQHSDTFEDYPLELWEQALSVNLTGMFLMLPGCGAAHAGSGQGNDHQHLLHLRPGWSRPAHL